MHTKKLQRTTKTAAGPRLASARTPRAAQPRHCRSASSTRREELAPARATAGQCRSTRARPQLAQATRCFCESTHAHPWLHSPKSAIGGRPSGKELERIGQLRDRETAISPDWDQNLSPGTSGAKTGFLTEPIEQLREEGRAPRPAQELVKNSRPGRSAADRAPELHDDTTAAAGTGSRAAAAAVGPRNDDKSPAEPAEKKERRRRPTAVVGVLDLPSVNRR